MIIFFSWFFAAKDHIPSFSLRGPCRFALSLKRDYGTSCHLGARGIPNCCWFALVVGSFALRFDSRSSGPDGGFEYHGTFLEIGVPFLCRVFFRVFSLSNVNWIISVLCGPGATGLLKHVDVKCRPQLDSAADALGVARGQAGGAL